MVLRFIHTADWHVGRRFGRFATEKAALLRAARERIPDRVAELAREQGASHVLVAGDIVDGPGVPDEELRRFASRLAGHRDLQWHLLPGNHDPASANGVWDRLRPFLEAAHIHVHREAAVVQLSGDAELLTAPLSAKAVAHDPTGWMDATGPRPGVVRVGLAHGAVKQFGSAAEASVPIAAERAARSGLDYLALGDWHGVMQVDARTWYSGTPEPDRFPDNEPGFALVVTIEGPGAVPSVTRHRTAAFHWRHQSVGSNRWQAPLTAVVDACSEARDRLLLEVEVHGHVTLSEALELEEQMAALSDRVFHLEVDRDGLEIAADLEGADALGDPLLDAVAAGLAERSAQGDETAAQALELLARLGRPPAASARSYSPGGGSRTG